MVSAADGGYSAAHAKALKLGEAFDEGEREEEEDAEAGEPGRDFDSCGSRASEDADGVKAGEDDDVDDDDAFVAERVSEGSNKVDEEPLNELVGVDKSQRW